MNASVHREHHDRSHPILWISACEPTLMREVDRYIAYFVCEKKTWERKACGICRSCQWLKTSNLHPNVRITSAQSNTQAVRQDIAWIARHLDALWIIHRIDKLHPYALQSLLKITEDHPLHLIATCLNMDALPETIQSRFHQRYFTPVLSLSSDDHDQYTKFVQSYARLWQGQWQEPLMTWAKENQSLCIDFIYRFFRDDAYISTSVCQNDISRMYRCFETFHALYTDMTMQRISFDRGLEHFFLLWMGIAYAS